MGQYPITAANIALILLGIVLIISAPVICYRTYKTLMRIKTDSPTAPLKEYHPISNGINFLIAFALGWAGVLFVINNLRGSYFG